MDDAEMLSNSTWFICVRRLRCMYLCVYVCLCVFRCVYMCVVYRVDVHVYNCM